MRKSKQKNKKGKTPLFILILILLWWFNNFTLKTNQVTVENEKINDSIKLVQISDLHGASFGKNNKHLIAKIERLNPDLIIATGDMYTNQKNNNGRGTALQLMKKLAENHEVYYVSGEHDYNDESFFTSMKNAGVKILNYDDEIITVKNTKLHLYGIDNVYYTSTFDLNNAFQKDKENYSVLLAHIPNFKKFSDFGTDLCLCGDTHGGIFRLPFIGAIYDGETFLPDKNGKYVKGIYHLRNSVLFITSGLGNYTVPIRFFNRPEIAVINLTPEK